MLRGKMNYLLFHQRWHGSLALLDISFEKQPKEEPVARPSSLAQLRMQLRAEREAEGHNRRPSEMSETGETWTGKGPAAKSHLKELTRLMEGARTEAGKNFSQLLQKLDNIKQARTS